jgi:glutathione S-transferase
MLEDCTVPNSFYIIIVPSSTFFLPCLPYFCIASLLQWRLGPQEDSERKEHFQKLIAGLASFSTELRKTSGATFLADHQLSNVDCALIPWAYRFYVFETYRGPDFAIPQTKELEAYHEWYDYVMNLESVKKTLPQRFPGTIKSMPWWFGRW